MHDLAQRVQDKRAELDRLRPLSARTLTELDRWYDVDLTYASNAIEGNTLTRNETAIVLERGLTVSGKSLKEHLEATGHRDALHFVRDLGRWSTECFGCCVRGALERSAGTLWQVQERAFGSN